MYGINIHFQSFDLNRHLVEHGDKIRISITTIPEEIKGAFFIEYGKTNNIHHFFTINVTPQTKKIIFVLRKKSFINNDPIIASTVVPVSELPQSATDTNNTEMKTVNIYEPVQQSNHQKYSNQRRQIVGNIQIQFKPTDAFPSSVFKHNNEKKNHMFDMVTLPSTNKAYARYGHISSENQDNNRMYSQNDDQGLFVDIDPEQIKNLNQLDNEFGQNKCQMQPTNQYQQQQNQYQQQQNQYQQNQNQYQQQQNQNQQQNQVQQQPNKMVFVNDLI